MMPNPLGVTSHPLRHSRLEPDIVHRKLMFRRMHQNSEHRRADELPSIPRRLIDLEIMHLAFLAAGRDRHSYASTGVGAACGPVPAFLIGIDQIAIFPMHHALA